MTETILRETPSTTVGTGWAGKATPYLENSDRK